SRLMAEWERQFAAKAQDYNDNQNENHRVLGVRGQFADIWRKIGKLKKALWDGQPLVGEQPREILMDLIAHCFLTIAMMDADPGDGTPEQPAVLTTEREGGNVHLAGDLPWALTSSGNMLSPDAQESRLWPRCGRERCTVHAM